MRQKKDWRDSLLTLAVFLSLFRGNIDEYMRGSIGSLPEVHDILLGSSAALTETQFHNLFNSIEGHNNVHPKNLDIDWHRRSAFTDLHTLYNDNRHTHTPQEITTFLLDRLEPNSARPFPFVNHVNTNSAGAVNTDSENNNDDNNNVDSSSSAGGNLNEANNEEGALPEAVAAPRVADLSPEDMDLIESLWRQDIDMGLSREDAFGYKSELLDKPDLPDKLKQQDAWQFEYNIDGETGEFVPIQNRPEEQVTVATPTQQGLTVQTETQLPATVPIENNLSLEECLQLIDEEYSPPPVVASPTETSDTFQSQLSPVDAEQRWQDLASIPELRYQLHTTASTEATQFQSQEVAPMMNVTQPPVENPFMMNATTNGNVNLQNATNVGQSMTQLDNLTILPPNSAPHEMPPQQPEIFSEFSPLSNFANLSLNASSAPSAALSAEHQGGMNFSNLLLDAQQAGGVSFPINVSAESGSLLLELLNDGVDEVDMEYDEQVQNLMDTFEVDSEDDGDSGTGTRSPYEELSDPSSPFSSDESVEGATGYNASLENDQLKGATGGYDGYHRRSRGSRRGFTGDNPNKDSFSNGFSSQPPKMENIKHNHTYSGSSSSHNGNGNSSKNGTSKQSQSERLERQRLSRDERRAKALKVPVNIDKVINLPVDAFNELMKKYDMNDAQTALIRDIRRRGKNKVAAQNCRKRKIDAIVGIEHTIHSLRADKDRLVRERDMIDKEAIETRDRYSQLYNEIFQTLRDESGDPVDPNDFTLQQMPDGSMFLVPRNGTSTQKDEDKTSQ